MKTLKFFVFGIMLLFAGSTQGQLSINVHIGTPPAWGPAGYNNVRYYYLPDVEAYYDVPSSMFIYFSGNRWVHRHNLPGRYRNYDLYDGYKVVMNDYRGDCPYYHFREHRMKYRRGYRDGEQRTIGERYGRNDYDQHDEFRQNRNDYRGQGRFNKHDREREEDHDQERGNGHGNGRGHDKDHGNRD